MALYIRDETVDDLVVKYKKATGASSKTEAVRKALTAGLAALTKKTTLAERIAVHQRAADDLGPVDPAFDQKTFSDAAWGDN